MITLVRYIQCMYTCIIALDRDHGSDLYVGIIHGDKLLPIEMVWEVIGKERAKASITYTKLKISHA